MEAKGIDAERNSYFMQLTLTGKKSVVQMIRAFLNRRKAAAGADAFAAYDNDIDVVMAEVARGETISHDEVLKMAKNS